MVAPSLPGFGFSEAPTRTGYGVPQIAATLDALMQALGYPRYLAQGEGPLSGGTVQPLGCLWPALWAADAAGSCPGSLQAQGQLALRPERPRCKAGHPLKPWARTGGDWGGFIGYCLGSSHSASCRGFHTNMPVGRPRLSSPWTLLQGANAALAPKASAPAPCPAALWTPWTPTAFAVRADGWPASSAPAARGSAHTPGLTRAAQRRGHSS